MFKRTAFPWGWNSSLQRIYIPSPTTFPGLSPSRIPRIPKEQFHGFGKKFFGGWVGSGWMWVFTSMFPTKYQELEWIWGEWGREVGGGR